MNPEVQFSRNRATLPEIEQHLQQCDSDFFPPLSARVNIADYARKLAWHATRFEAWQQNTLVGLVAAYCNDLTTRAAFISNVSVLTDLQFLGVGTSLLKQCIEYVRAHGFVLIHLHVDHTNEKAIRFYQRCGFNAVALDGQLTMMKLDVCAGRENA